MKTRDRSSEPRPRGEVRSLSDFAAFVGRARAAAESVLARPNVDIPVGDELAGSTVFLADQDDVPLATRSRATLLVVREDTTIAVGAAIAGGPPTSKTVVANTQQARGEWFPIHPTP